MDWFAPVDIYCERLDPSFWSEPLNAITNGAFVFAAFWAMVEARRRGVTHFAVRLLIFLTICIGVGSFLFHTVATRWSAAADTLPIMLFILSYAVAALALIGTASTGRIVLYTSGIIAFLAGSGYVVALSGIDINGSEGYLPALAAMIIITALAWLRDHPVFGWFAAATVTFPLSLTLRSLDMALCDLWPYGTHIFWHLLNATVIAMLLQALIRNTTRTAQR